MVARIVQRHGSEALLLSAAIHSVYSDFFLIDVHFELYDYSIVFMYSEEQGQREDTDYFGGQTKWPE